MERKAPPPCPENCSLIEGGSCHLGQRWGRGNDASENWTEAIGGCRSEDEESLATVEPSTPAVKVKCPSRAMPPHSLAHAPITCGGQPCKKWQQQAWGPGGS